MFRWSLAMMLSAGVFMFLPLLAQSQAPDDLLFGDFAELPPAYPPTEIDGYYRHYDPATRVFSGDLNPNEPIFGPYYAVVRTKYSPEDFGALTRFYYVEPTSSGTLVAEYDVNHEIRSVERRVGDAQIMTMLRPLTMDEHRACFADGLPDQWTLTYRPVTAELMSDYSLGDPPARVGREFCATFTERVPADVQRGQMDYMLELKIGPKTAADFIFSSQSDGPDRLLISRFYREHPLNGEPLPEETASEADQTLVLNLPATAQTGGSEPAIVMHRYYRGDAVAIERTYKLVNPLWVTQTCKVIDEVRTYFPNGELRQVDSYDSRFVENLGVLASDGQFGTTDGRLEGVLMRSYEYRLSNPDSPAGRVVEDLIIRTIPFADTGLPAIDEPAVETVRPMTGRSELNRILTHRWDIVDGERVRSVDNEINVFDYDAMELVPHSRLRN